MSTEVPIACTLPPSEYRSRLTDIAALGRGALRHVERLVVTAPPAAAEAVPGLLAELTGRRP